MKNFNGLGQWITPGKVIQMGVIHQPRPVKKKIFFSKRFSILLITVVNASEIKDLDLI